MQQHQLGTTHHNRLSSSASSSSHHPPTNPPTDRRPTATRPTRDLATPSAAEHPNMPTSTSDARFSTYSAAPSLQPSLAASSSHRNSSLLDYRHSSRYSEQLALMHTPILEKGGDRAPFHHHHHHLYVKRSPSSLDNESSLTLSSTDSKTADIKNFAQHLDRMRDARLVDKQRYCLSNDKSENMGKIALGARVERALSRRMVGQDAVFRPKKKVALPGAIDEKRALEVQAN